MASSSPRARARSYHRNTWPRRTRCKEGNLAFFYDHYGYDPIRFCRASLMQTTCRTQTISFRCCVPSLTRLWAMSPLPASAIAMPRKAGPRADGFMPKPVCMALCRPVTTTVWRPLCIGSHYAVRTAALKEIGGLGPELAEDHSTTLMMNAHGWRGVHAHRRHRPWRRSAHLRRSCHSGVSVVAQSGDDPAAAIRPGLCADHLRRLKFQFLFSQFWYPLFSLFMAPMFLLPIFALASGGNFMNVTYPDFLAISCPSRSC